MDVPSPKGSQSADFADLHLHTNFSDGTLNAPMLRSSIFAALIRLDAPRANWAEIRVGSETNPSDVTKPSCSIVTNAPVSTSRRAGCPLIEHGTVSAPVSSR